MRVFFAGASGVIGRRLVPRLVKAGHEVFAMTRSPGKAAGLQEAGATPVVCDALDSGALRDAMAGARPDALIHHLTDLGPLADPRALMSRRRMDSTYAANDRVRVQGAENLVAAASEAGAGRIVVQSIAFAYAPGPGLRREDDPLFRTAPEPFDQSVLALERMERALLEAPLDALVLRFGFWYGPGTGFSTRGGYADLVRRRRFPIVGGGDGVFSFVHIDDVADATAVALENGSAGLYNVVDDDPAPTREWLPRYAEAIGAKRPRRVPAWIARLIAGDYVAYLGTELPGASNEKARRELGWQPRQASWRRGFREALE